MKTLLLCMEIFFARMLDVSIGSVRMIYLVKQKNLIACILAFIEILIWFLVARETLAGDEINFFIVISYAGGYAVGTYVGGLINKFFVKGTLTAMVITIEKKRKLIDVLREANYGVSIVGLEDEKIMLIVEFKKKNLKKLKELIKKIDRKAFIIVNESLNVENGYIH